MMVLGLETSCDETGIAVYDGERGLLADLLYSQADTHAPYGGVIPELASRDHIRKALPLIRAALAKAGIAASDIDGVAYTAGPGLIGALLVGACLGRSIAYSLGVPAIGVHHMEGHLLAPMLEDDPPPFPFVALLVSGGHTQLVAAKGLGRYEMLGESRDDAAGEAFDKVGKMLGLPYPGGPHVARLARDGRTGFFTFPRPMTDRPGLDFSFSGLKTAVRTAVADASGGNGELSRQTRADIALAFEEAAVATLTHKCRAALAQTGLKSLVIAGGVSANQRLRQVLGEAASDLGARLYYAAPRLCTDNGAMIAYAGYRRLLAGQSASLEVVTAPRWAMDSLPALSRRSAPRSTAP